MTSTYTQHEPTTLKGSILVICGGNVSRSAAAFALLNEALDAFPVELASAGLQSRPGMPIEPRIVEALGRRVPTTVVNSFRSQSVSPDLLDESDLVLTATLSQRADVVRLSPSSIRVTFTVLEFAQLATRVSLMLAQTGESRPQTVADFVGLVPLVRGSRPFVGSLDLGDPLGRSQRTHTKVVAQIDAAVSSIVGAIVG